MFSNRFIDSLKSEPAYWVAQNSVGAVLPLLFGLVTTLRFPLACVAIVFYGITSQTLSNNNTIGGRMIAGVLFMGATLSGGLIGFSVVSLSWLSRGSNVKSLLETAHELDLPEFREYFKGSGDFYDAINLVYKDIELILQANNTAVPTVFWVLILVLFAVMSLPWAWMRSTSSTTITVGISIMGLSLTCTLVIFGMLMPVTGQYAYWTLVYGGFLKASCVSMLGMVLSALVIYVKSSHDEVRKVFGKVLRDSGRTISHVSSCMQESMRAAASSNVSFMDVPSQLVSHVDEYDNSLRSVSVKHYLKILDELQAANGFLSTSKAEPPIPGFASQWGSNVTLYTEVCASTVNVVSQIGCIEMIYLSIKKGMEKASQDSSKAGQQSWMASRDVSTGLSIVEAVTSVCASISSVLQSSSDALTQMPLLKPCSGNRILWRPKPKSFWVDLHRQLLALVEDTEISMYFEKSGISGIREILDNYLLKSMPFRLGGSSLVLFTAVESLIDYMIQLEQDIAKALDITEYDSFDPGDIHAMIRTNCVGDEDSINQKCSLKASKKTGIAALKTSPVFKAIVLNVFLGTGVLGIFVYLLGCLGIVRRIKSLIFKSKLCDPLDESKRSGPTSQQLVYFIKYWSGILLLIIGVILIGWLAVGDSSSNLYNQKQIAEYLLKWMPFNAPIAVAICLNTTIDTSIIKIFLRTSMIAFGGVLGFITMLNGKLAQNPYFIFWINIVVNAFFSLFSSVGYYARYSLFLVVYTYFSVVMCQYLGKCCTAGDVWEFAGRTISTIIGAAFALLFNWLVMPVYSSQVIFNEEMNLFRENVATVHDSLEDGPSILSHKKPENPQNGTPEILDEEDALMVLYKTISDKTVSSFKTRLSICSKILEEKRINSLDDWRFFVFDITLIPLPFACKQAFVRVGRMGLHINVCMHALKNSIYPYSQGMLNELILSTMMDDTAGLLKATQELYGLIKENLSQTSREENSKTEIRMISLLDLIVDIRLRLSNQFETCISSRSASGNGTISPSDLKCLVFFQYIYASLDEVYHLGLELCKNESMKLRDNYYSFIVAFNRKQADLSLEI